jgi:hypothetical protein
MSTSDEPVGQDQAQDQPEASAPAPPPPPPRPLPVPACAAFRDDGMPNGCLGSPALVLPRS